jgi:hypothetical protein
MAKKIRRARTFARTAAKSLEKRLVENAKKLKKDPYLILPDYTDDYSRKYFEKIKKWTRLIDLAMILKNLRSCRISGALMGPLQEHL